MSNDRQGHEERPSAEPERLVDSRWRFARSLRSYQRATVVSDSVQSRERQILAQIQQRLDGRPRGRRWVAAFGCATLAASAAFVLWSYGGRSPDKTTVAPMVSAPVRPAPALPASVTPSEPQPQVTMAAAPGLELRPAPQPIPAGTTELARHARVTLAGAATARSVGEVAEIALARGTIEVTVAPAASGRTRVLVAPYSFIDVGTHFSLVRNGTEISLAVDEGMVEVRLGARRVAVVTGPDGVWTNRQVPRPVVSLSEAPTAATVAEAPVVPAPVEPAPIIVDEPAPRAAAPSALVPVPQPAELAPAAPAPLVACDTQDPDPNRVLACLQTKADQRAGVGAEAALYEIGRLKRDRLRDATGALAAFEAHRRRFPQGILRLEVTLSLVDLLPRVGRYEDALTLSAKLLAGNPELERADELHLLRGNVLREALGRPESALAEYANVKASVGVVADDARFFHAACLDALGRANEAASAYRAYLERPRAAHAREAKQRLDVLAP